MYDGKRIDRRIPVRNLLASWVLTVGVLTTLVPLIPVDAARAGDSLRDSHGDWDDWKGGRQSIVRMGEDIVVEADDVIDGDVVAIGGKVTVYGTVKGDVVSIGGGVKLKSGCLVERSAVAVAGELEQEDGAIVEGENVSVGGWPRMMPHIWNFSAVNGFSPRPLYGLRIWKDFLTYLSLFLVGLILYLAFPARADVVRHTVRNRFWLSLVSGFGSAIGVAIAMVLLIITCVGILIAVPAGFLTALACIGGGAVAVSLMGELMLRRPITDRSSWILALSIGLASIFAVRMLGNLLGMTGGAGDMIGHFLRSVSKAALSVLMITGFGALIISRFGSPPRVIEIPMTAGGPGMPVAPPQPGSAQAPPSPPPPPQPPTPPPPPPPASP